MDFPFEIFRDWLGPALAEGGYTNAVQVNTRRGDAVRPLSLDFRMPNDGQWITGTPPSLTLYVQNAYPDERGEVFLEAWNWVGSSFKATRLQAVLERRGITARVTRRKKCNGLAIVVPSEVAAKLFRG